MKCGLGGGQGEDQPSLTSIDGSQAENIAEEGSIGLRVLTVNDDMSAGNHETLLS